ncbi:MAG: type IX secretion system anionic LPS delivery protein PorZ [Chlorobiales bacterium]
MFKLARLFFLSVFSLSLSASSLFAQTSWRTFASLSSASSVAVADGGDVWVATSGGLYRFNPNTNQTETFTNLQGLADIRLTSLELDASRNALWIGSLDGVITSLALSNKQFTNSFALANVTQFPQKRIQGFALSGDSLLVATDFGALLYTPSRREIRESYLTLGTFPTGTEVRTILFADTLIVAGTPLGIAIASRKTQNLLAPSSWQSLSLANVNQVATFNGKLYIGTSTSLLAYSVATQNFETVATDSVIALRTANGRLYALMKSGMLSISTSGTTSMFAFNFSTATDIDVASDETAFISDARQSLLVLRNQSVSAISLNTPLANRFEYFGVDSRGRLWVSSTVGDRSTAGFYRMDFTTERWTNFASLSASGLNGTLTQFNAFGIQGSSIYLSGWGNGLVEFLSDDSVRAYSRFNAPTLSGPANAPNFIVITDLISDANSVLWMANYLSANGALTAKLPNGTFLNFATVNSSASGLNGFPAGVFSFRLTLDNLGRKWVACRSQRTDEGAGVMIFDDNGTLDSIEDDRYIRLTTAPNQGNLPNLKINAIKTDLEGAIWFATDEGAAYYFDASLVQPGFAIPSVTRIFDLQDEVLTALAIDALNRKWFGSTNGVWLLSPDGSSVIAHYTETNSPLLSNRVLAIEVDKPSGRVFVGTERGLSVIQTVAVQPTATMSDLKIAPNPVRLPEHQAIQIQGLSRNASVKIITATGRLVRNLKSDGGAVVFWDGKDNRGELVASGVYIAVGISESGKESGLGKIAVIRGR